MRLRVSCPWLCAHKWCLKLLDTSGSSKPQATLIVVVAASQSASSVSCPLGLDSIQHVLDSRSPCRTSHSTFCSKSDVLVDCSRSPACYILGAKTETVFLIASTDPESQRCQGPMCWLKAHPFLRILTSLSLSLHFCNVPCACFCFMDIDTDQKYVWQ